MVIQSRFPGTCDRCKHPFPSGARIQWSRGTKPTHETATDCFNATQRAQSTPPAPPPQMIDLKAIVEFLTQAKEKGGLKRPKLRILAPDGVREVRLSLTTTGVAPGSLSVVLNGEFIGAVRPTGEVRGKLAQDMELQKHLLYVSQNPTNAVKEYASMMSICSFCGKPLTDAGSVQCGYGPVCAKHWGLPHVALGTPTLGHITV